MKFGGAAVLAVLLAATNNNKGVAAFGPAQPLKGGLQNNAAGNSLTMRTGHADLLRRQKINDMLQRVHEQDDVAAAVQEELLAPETAQLLEKCNWKLRRMLLRKVTTAAVDAGVAMPANFGKPLTQAEREQAEQAAGQERKAARVAHFAQQAAALEEHRVAKAAAKQAKAAKAEAKAAEKKAAKAAAPAPEAAAPAPAPEAAAPAPAPAAPAAADSGNKVTPKTIKALRDSTGAGMMDCKKALLECDGDAEAAAEFLRAKGLAKADKKASRVAAEGKIAVAQKDGKAVMVEVNCETDFVAKDASFLSFVDKIADTALGVDGDSVDSLMASQVDGETLEAERQALVAKIGENIQVRRMASRGSADTTTGVYVHMNRIGVIVELEGGDESVCTDIAMHVAAMNPPFATADEVPADVLEKEKQFLTEQALESGKPPEIVEKMVGGRIRKYLEEICLDSQPFVKDGDKTVGKYAAEKGAKIIGFTRIAVGEGIEKKEDNFAEEVAQMAGAPAPAPEAAAPEPAVAPKEEEPAAAAAPAPAAAVTPKTIKALRDSTGAGMMDCKKALLECDGDAEAAAEFLRAKGLAKADKKASRVAAEGKIAVAQSDGKAVMVEVNCETDFVAKDASFLSFVDKIADTALSVEGDSVDSLMGSEVDGETLEAERQALVAKIGENIQVRRMASRGSADTTTGVYVHMNRIGVMVELEGGDESLCTDIAMHVAAMNPPYATADEVPADVLEKEKQFLTEQALESGKPPEIVEKMVGGRIRKYLEEICLDSQPFVKDGDKTVGKYAAEKGAKIIGFTRLAVGEGIEKKEDNFAEEVAQMAGASA